MGLQKFTIFGEFNPLVKEQRSGADLFYFDRGDKIDIAADEFSNEVRTFVRTFAIKYGLAVDKIMLHGLRSLEAQGFEIMEGEKLRRNVSLLREKMKS